MTRVEYGDWQTPPALCRAVLRLVREDGFAPAAVLEPTCGTGGFLAAAREAFPRAALAGFDRNEEHLARAARDVPEARLALRDAFRADWRAEVAALPRPLLVVGNPPWVTNAALGARGSANLPGKTNERGARGIEALTGASNFDVSEWLLLELLRALDGIDFRLAMLCKAHVARKVIGELARSGRRLAGALHRVDARAAFGAAVEAVLLTVRPARTPGPAWPVYPSLDAARPEREIGVAGGALCADAALHAATRALEGRCVPEWRSGVKHDCAAVMELRRRDGSLVNGLGEKVDVEESVLFPLLKGSDLANGRAPGDRFVLVPQRGVSEPTERLRSEAPRAFAYLARHAERLAARRSRVYRGRPPFSIFGVGAYTFAPFKVALSALHKRTEFVLVAPHGGRPVLVDDTCYFLPFAEAAPAARALAALRSRAAADFLRARSFPDAKRPVAKGLLQTLDLARLEAEEGRRSGRSESAAPLP